MAPLPADSLRLRAATMQEVAEGCSAVDLKASLLRLANKYLARAALLERSRRAKQAAPPLLAEHVRPDDGVA
jgi:hypothetical protein